MSLTVSQRIKTIIAIAEKLGSESFGIIDLTLTQFKLPVSDQWQGTAEDYVLQHVSSALDSSLIGLAEHVGLAPPRPDNEEANEDVRPVVQPSFWRKHHFRLFLSHLSEHQRYAGELQARLEDFGISCFVAHKDIAPTREWQDEIELGLRTCDSLLAIMHIGFRDSEWTDQEVGFVMGRSRPAFSISMGANPNGFISRFQAFNGNNKSVFELGPEIVTALCSNKQTGKRMGDALLHRFERSESFSVSSELIDYLESFEEWGVDFSSRLQNALNSNSQIYNEGKTNVPNRVEKLISKWS